MTRIYLLTRPEHDDTTYYLSQWSRETISVAERKGLKVIDLHRERANRKEFESAVSKVSPQLIVLNGHGDEHMVTGHDNAPLIVTGENENLLKAKIVYAVSCKSAKTLGPKNVEAGAINYTGYEDDFIFVTENEKASKPLDDETARLFLDPSTLFITSLIKGNSVGESHERSKNLLRTAILQLSGSNMPDTALIRFLWWDLKHFVSHGDQKAAL